jgi:hypothetical protein
MKLTSVFFAALAVSALAQNNPPATASAGVIPTNLPANGPPAPWNSVYNSLVSQGVIPSTLTAAPWPTGSYGPGQGPWVSGGPRGYHGLGGGRHWGGTDGVGPWGTGGPWSLWSANSEWRTNGPWTNWWGGSACPGTDWPGWTAGPWGTSPPWTSWAGCTARTTATNVVTTTVSGSALASTAYGIQVAAANAASSGARGTSVSSDGSTAAAAPMRTVGPILAVGAAILEVVAW